MSDSNTFKSLEEQLQNLQKSVLFSTQIQQASLKVLTQLKDLVLSHQTTQMQSWHPNPLNKFGRKCFSQTDEDGITLEIIRRLNIENGVYAEFGVGNGLENNTLILASLGWKGFWVGGEDLAINYSSARRFKYIKDWITLDNILSHACAGLESLAAKQADIISLDLDGNDIYFVEELLSNDIHPKLFIVEYNAKFIPPSKFQIEYNATHQWHGDDYFGAALTNFVDLFNEFGYDLVCCNSHSGANAFFVKKEYQRLFSDVPTRVIDIYTGPRYFLHSSFGHKISPKVIESIINQ